MNDRKGNQHRGNGIGHKVFVASVLIAIFFFLILLGDPIIMPFPWKLTLNNPSVSMVGHENIHANNAGTDKGMETK